MLIVFKRSWFDLNIKLVYIDRKSETPVETSSTGVKFYFLISNNVIEAFLWIKLIRQD